MSFAMNKFFLLVGLLAVVNGTASAEIFNTNGSVTIDVTKSPDTASVRVDLDSDVFTPFGEFSFVGFPLDFQINILPGTTKGSEWLVFRYTSISLDALNDTPLSGNGLNWSILESHIPTLVDTKLVAVLDEFTGREGGDLISPVNTPDDVSLPGFPGYRVIGKSLPIDGSGFYWWGKTGLSIKFPANQVSTLGAFLDPFNQIEGLGIDTLAPFGFTQALEFTPLKTARVARVASAAALDTPEPSTWTTLGIGFASMGWLGWRRKLATAKM
jgi:hypothetical protein